MPDLWEVDGTAGKSVGLSFRPLTDRHCKGERSAAGPRSDVRQFWSWDSSRRSEKDTVSKVVPKVRLLKHRHLMVRVIGRVRRWKHLDHLLGGLVDMHFDKRCLVERMPNDVATFRGWHVANNGLGEDHLV